MVLKLFNLFIVIIYLNTYIIIQGIYLLYMTVILFRFIFSFSVELFFYLLPFLIIETLLTQSK